MSTGRWFREQRLWLLAPLVTATLVVVVTLGGCPVQQQPVDTGEDSGQGAGSGVNTPTRPATERPVPPPPVDEGTLPGDGGQPGGGGGLPNPGTDPGEEPTEPQAQALRVVILGPNVNAEVKRNEAVEVEYRVDGEAQSVELFYNLEGGQSGVIVQSNLNVEGTVEFSTDQPGVYALGVRAANVDSEAEQLAPGRVTVVGQAQVSFSKPSQNLVIRPNVPVAVAYAIDTLAATVSSKVYVDPNRQVDGDETEVLTSTLKAVNDAIPTQGLTLGVEYSIYVQVTDSADQTTGRIYSNRTFRIVPAPTIDVTAPTGSLTINAGDPVVVQFVGTDSENQATITVFVDFDGIFNGDEDVIASDLAITETSYAIDTTDFGAGSYRFGAWVTDNLSGEIFASDYAPGTRTIPGIAVNAPAVDTTVRTPTQVELRWTATYPASQFPTHEAVIALDADNDGVPDGPLSVLAAGFAPGPNTHQVSTVGLKGRYLVGVRLKDTVGGEIVRFASGDIIVLNDAPTARINSPTGALAARPGTPQAQIPMNFTITDTENVGGLLDIRVLVARDDDRDGAPDGPAVLSVTSAAFRIGVNNFTFDATAIDQAGLIGDPQHDGFGWFVLGVRVTDDAGQQATVWLTNGLYVDKVIPQVALDSIEERPVGNVTKDRIGTLKFTISVADSSPNLVAVILDTDLNPNNTNSITLLADEVFTTNEQRMFEVDLDPTTNPNAPPSGFYFWRLVAQEVPQLTGDAHYVPRGVLNPSAAYFLWIRDRLIGTVKLGDLTDPEDGRGAILQGFNFNDLGGSSMDRVPDVDNDGDDEFVIVSRFGKPFILNNTAGVGFGEAYLLYGNGGNNNLNAGERLVGAQTLNAVGNGHIKGLSFPGIRIPLNATAGTTGMTEGISDVAVVSDMDGDNLPEMVFSFPRAESINLGTTDTTFQHPELLPDLPSMGSLEYNALTPFGWSINRAQFTRGGVVVVSSHNSNITGENQLNRKGDRLIDLHEIGQMFSTMARPSVKQYIIGVGLDFPPVGMLTCPNGAPPTIPPPAEPVELEWLRWVVQWDDVFNWSGNPEERAHAPGGFHQPWTAVPADPPLANPSMHPGLPPYIYYPDLAPPTCEVPDPLCEYRNVPYVWPPQPLAPFPCGNRADVLQWNVGGNVHWTGFYGATTPEVSIRDFSVGARIMGQVVDDRFGTAVASDGTWLYMSAPRHTATVADVPLLPDVPGTRAQSGAVYMYRTESKASQFAPTRSQLWMETVNDAGETLVWPDVDGEPAKGPDGTMPVPHQYIIETVGSTRSDLGPGADYNFPGLDCVPGYPGSPFYGGQQANVAGSCYEPSAVGTAHYYMDRTPQIVGPHTNARVSFVRNVGDINDDGLQDFAVGSSSIRDNFNNPQAPSGPTVGGIFMVFGRSLGLEGDYLLENLQLAPNDPQRLTGVLLKGTATEVIARVFDGAGDFNGDGIDDVVVGSETNQSSQGQAIVIFGSRTLLSPQGGFTLDGIVNAGRAIRFIGAEPGDLAGANVAGAGDVDFDGMGDILIAAPGANPLNDPNGAPGAVYLIYGSRNYEAGVIDLSLVGTPQVPGVVFVGRKMGDFLGGGTKALVVNPDSQPTTIHSRGVAAIGDIDGDGRGDYAIGSILADPNTKTDAGEVYILYGRGDRPPLAP
jgi:hypothetical protein